MRSSPHRPAARAPRAGARPHVRPARLALALALTAVAGTRMPAQVTTADEGSFTVTRGGATVGREEFRILRQPAGGGTELVARALAAYGDRRIAPALQTDERGSPLRYQVEVRTGRTVEQRLTGQLARGRFATQMQAGSTESAREYLIGDGTLVVDDELFHQYYFLALRRTGAGAGLSVLAPRRNVHGPVRVSEAGAERVTVGGRTLDATRLEVTEAGGRTRTVWVDGGGRVLRVASPSERLVAQRDDPPS